MDDILVPISLFLVLRTILVTGIYFKHRTRQEVQLTIRESIASGKDLAPEFIEQVVDSLNPPLADLRRGLISMSIGLATLIFAFAVGEPDALGPLVGLATFPFLIGLAFLIVWRMNRTAP